jgi:apolipoprotein N-acyltransferase
MGFVDRRPVVWVSAAVVLTAGMLLLGDGMTPVWWLMWLAFVPVLLLAAETSSWRIAGGGAAVAMLVGSLGLLRYLHWGLGLPVMAWVVPMSIASVVFAAGVLLFRGLLRRGFALSAVIALPALWTVFEYAASFVPANGTAGSLAYTQEAFLPVLQVASLTGPWGISFLLLLFPSAVVSGVYLRRRKMPGARLVVVSAMGVLAAALVFGGVRLGMPRPQKTMKVGLLDTDSVAFAEQAATMQRLVGSYAQHAETLTREGAQIVVMPEKTGLLLATNAASVDPALQSVADSTGATLVMGMLHVAGGDSFNEARIYAPGRAVAMYHKEHMLPPFESDLKPGRSLTLLSGEKVPRGVAVCKDMDFIHPALDYGRAGVDLLLDPAWDFTVDRTWHGHIAIMRGVEGGYAIAHAAKFGFLTVTDDRGRILGQVPTDKGGFASLLVEVPLEHDRTLFDRWGTWFPWVAVGLLVGVGVRWVMYRVG